MNNWQQIVHELSNRFGLKVERRGIGIVGIYLGYAVVGDGYNCIIVYNVKCSRFEETQDIKFAIECLERYLPIIKKWKVQFREQALESDFK